MVDTLGDATDDKHKIGAFETAAYGAGIRMYGINVGKVVLAQVASSDERLVGSDVRTTRANLGVVIACAVGKAVECNDGEGVGAAGRAHLQATIGNTDSE